MPRDAKRTGEDPSNEPIASEPSIDTATPSANGPKIGDVVICTNRLPSPLRPWEHPIWIGVIEEPGSDPSRWNGKYSEAAYCVHTKKLKVRYHNPDNPSDSFAQHDKVASLIVLSENEAKLTGIDAVRHFLGLVAAHQYQQHVREQAQPEIPTELAEPPAAKK
jgi:hypothetical protein